eukprot:COSAG01_NODE_441_length_17032_cov_27.546389_9_plen_222_part_00
MTTRPRHQHQQHRPPDSVQRAHILLQSGGCRFQARAFLQCWRKLGVVTAELWCPPSSPADCGTRALFAEMAQDALASSLAACRCRGHQSRSPMAYSSYILYAATMITARRGGTTKIGGLTSASRYYYHQAACGAHEEGVARLLREHSQACVNQRLGKMADAANWTAQLLPSGQTLAPIRHLLRNPACTPEARGGRWWLAICVSTSSRWLPDCASHTTYPLA